MTGGGLRTIAPLGLVVFLASGGGMVGLGARPAGAAGCGEYGALATADGGRSYTSAPGSAPTDVDGQGPAAQAQADSTAGSNGYAGVPFSNTAAGNAGAANVDATKVPVFATSQYPAQPSASTSTPAASVESKSEERSSTAKATAGGPGSEQATTGQALASASASCDEQGTIKAAAQSLDQVIDIAGVLRIGSIRSTATATVTPDGNRTLDATIAIEGATVAGQAVSITDEGLVIGSSPTPLPGDNPVTKALADAGIRVGIVGTSKDDTHGDVIAPSLSITVVKDIAGSGTGPKTTTFTFGRAYARATGTPGDAITVDRGSTDAVGPDQLSPASADMGTPTLPLGPAVAPAPTGHPTRPTGGGRQVALRAQPIADASTSSVYPALALGALVLAAAGLAFKTLGVKLRWN